MVLGGCVFLRARYPCSAALRNPPHTLLVRRHMSEVPLGAAVFSPLTMKRSHASGGVGVLSPAVCSPLEIFKGVFSPLISAVFSPLTMKLSHASAPVLMIWRVQSLGFRESEQVIPE